MPSLPVGLTMSGIKTDAGNCFLADSKFVTAMATCRILFEQADRLDASRAAWMAGSSSATRMPMIAITTSNSTNVKPVERFLIKN